MGGASARQLQCHCKMADMDFVERVAALYVLWKAEIRRRLVQRSVWFHQILQKRTELGEFHFSLSSKQDPFYSCFCKSKK